MRKRTVVLTSYIRPEMTKRSIEKISSWKGLNQLVVVIDGLRPGATDQEALWRQETISIVESFDSLSNLELWVYSDNIGITEHNLRLQFRSLTLDEFPILLEEDIDLDLDEFNYLDSSAGFNLFHPTLRSGFSHFDHPRRSSLTFKGNLFLPLWGLSYNAALVELVQKTWKDKKYSPKIVTNTLAKVFSSRNHSLLLYRRRMEKFWVEYMSWAFINRSRWDALANYSLWTKGLFSSSAINRLANDISFTDVRGMNQRTQPSPTPLHTLKEINVDGITFCEDCEIAGSRISRSFRTRVANSLNYRVAKLGLRKD